VDQESLILAPRRRVEKRRQRAQEGVKLSGTGDQRRCQPQYIGSRSIDHEAGRKGCIDHGRCDRFGQDDGVQ
jgi:hypothetical protein